MFFCNNYRYALDTDDSSIEVFDITFQDGDRFNSCQVSYSQFGLAIHQNDHQARRTFIEWAQNEIAVVPNFHKRILFSDDRYIQKNCLSHDYYFFIPELNNHDVQELWFQQDGATCHTARATIDLLKDTFGDRLISRFGPVNWPPRSCDLTPLDYFLWGYVTSLVYADKPQTLDHLEDNIRRVIADVRPQMLEKVIENWTSRLDYIRASRGKSTAGDFTYVHSSPRAHRYNNGTLVLSDVEENDSGSYLCQASNGIGAGLSKIITLKVLVPPRFKDPYQSKTVTEGMSVTVTCSAVGDPPINIKWLKNKSILDAKKNTRCVHKRLTYISNEK
ncbi:down syndrome cell adhesion molecule-like protein Dscam2 [Trichonephila clavipes]|nr:down syndrome cell adhesion molecule-like protein Dscam2 [Trichonephila clavipes]